MTDPATPFEREIIKGSMRAVQLEMELLIERTSMSPFIREKRDFFAGIFDGRGRLVLGTALPFFGNLLMPILERFPVMSMRPGDIFAYNDCYGSDGGVSHTPDMVFAAPVFQGGQVVAFVQTWGHMYDLGGIRPGSISPDAREVFHEGIIIPPTRMVQAGEVREDILAIIVRNSRFPDVVRGDIRSLLAACTVGAERLLELFERHGPETMHGAWAAFDAQTRSVLEQELEEIPDGDYYAEDAAEFDGVADRVYAIRLYLSKHGGELRFDFTKSDDQAAGPINFIMHHSVPKLMLALYLLADHPEVVVNHACIEALGDVSVRQSSILAPDWPAALGNRTHVEKRLQSTILRLLALASPGRVPAPNAIFSICFIRGRDPAAGQAFLCSDGVAVGYGGRPRADGLDAVYYHAQQNYPAEFLETAFPVRLRRYGIHADSGGPGRHRGGCGVVREYEILVDEAVVGIRQDSIKLPPRGVDGGGAGRPGHIDVISAYGSRRLQPMSDGNVLRRGDRLRIVTSGGGGWGDPAERPVDEVVADVRNGFVSVAGAAADYSVTIDPETLEAKTLEAQT